MDYVLTEISYCVEQFYNGIMFNVKEFWVKKGMTGLNYR